MREFELWCTLIWRDIRQMGGYADDVTSRQVSPSGWLLTATLPFDTLAAAINVMLQERAVYFICAN